MTDVDITDVDMKGVGREIISTARRGWAHFSFNLKEEETDLEYGMISVTGPEEVSQELLNRLDEWQGMLQQLDLTAESTYDSVEVFREASKGLFEIWIMKLQGERRRHLEGSLVKSSSFMSKRMRLHQEQWLESVSEIEKMGKVLPESKKESTYELIFTFLIEF
jgi:hypothetical protein